MKTENQTFFQQMSSIWSKLTPSQQIFISAMLVILVVAFSVWIGVAKQPAYALLFGGLEPADAGRLVSELQSRDIPYKIREGGRAIHVPAEQVDELRISLASQGFSPSGTSGYEILDKSQLGMSDYTQRTNYKRALEGELSRTLMSLDEVSAARVHLTMAEPSAFIEDQTESSASVVIKLRNPGVTLSREKIAAVRTFVAGAIGSTNPDSVTIIDQNMNLLSGPTAAQPGGLLPSQEEARRNYELQRAADIRSLLERAYGVGKVAVSFSCTMDFDRVQTENITYQPIEGTNHGVIVSEELTETSSEGTQTSISGIPGTESNIPSYPATGYQPIKSETTSETKNYEVSKQHEIRTQAPGTVKSASVSVLIDSTGRDILPSEKAEAEKLVAAAAGINTARGDVLTVAFREFDTSLQAELQEQTNLQSRMFTINKVINAVIALFAIIIFFIIIKNFMKPLEKPLPVSIPAQPVSVAEEVSFELPRLDQEALEKIRMREEIEKLIKDDPEAAAKVIKTWLQE